MYQSNPKNYNKTYTKNSIKSHRVRQKTVNLKIPVKKIHSLKFIKKPPRLWLVWHQIFNPA